MSRFVLDNSVTMAWCFSDEATDFTRSALSRLSSLTDVAVVPSIWLYELANVTELAVRKGRINELKASEFLDSLQLLPINVENPSTTIMFGPIRRLAKAASAYRLRRFLSGTRDTLVVTDCVTR